MEELNLLPPYLKERKHQRIKIRNYLLFGIILVSIIFSLIYIPLSQLSRVRAEEKNYKKSAEAVNSNSLASENETIEKQIKIFKDYIERVEQITQNKTTISNRLGELEQYIPTGIIFDSLTYDKKALTINGTALNINSISEFAENLLAIEIYKNVRISNIIKENKAANGNTTNINEVYKFIIIAVE